MEPSSLPGILRFFNQAVLNGIWQTALLTLLIALLLFALKKENASTRYAIWLTALFLLLLLPLAAMIHPAPETLKQQNATAALTPASAAVPEQAAMRVPAFVISPLISTIALVLLIAIAFARLVTLFRCWMSLARIKRESVVPPDALNAQFQRMAVRHGITRNVELRLSNRNGFPITAGFRNPVVLIPQNVASSLQADQLEQIWMHELAHIQRWDDYTRLIQKAFEAVFFFYPAVFWIAKQLDLEREIACDDMVLKQTGQARSYANSLTRLIELSGCQSSALAPGALLSRTQFCRRIEMLLNKDRNRSTSLSAPRLAFVLAILAIIFVFLLRVSPLVAVSPAPEAHTRLQAAASRLHSAEQEMWTASEQKRVSRDVNETAEAQRMMDAARARMRSAIKEMEQAKKDLTDARAEMRSRGMHETFVMKQMRIQIPKVSVHVPAMDIGVPEHNYKIAGEHVNVPGQSIHVDAIDVEVPEGDLLVPVPEAPPAVLATPEISIAAPATRGAPAPSVRSVVTPAPEAAPRMAISPLAPRIAISPVAPRMAISPLAPRIAITPIPRPGIAVTPKCSESATPHP